MGVKVLVEEISSVSRGSARADQGVVTAGAHAGSPPAHRGRKRLRPEYDFDRDHAYMSDRSFRERYRLTREAFDQLVHRLEPHISTTPVQAKATREYDVVQNKVGKQHGAVGGSAPLPARGEGWGGGGHGRDHRCKKKKRELAMVLLRDTHGARLV